MTDKNGREIHTGDVVRISNAFFKTDNGLYFVDNSPGDVSWYGYDYSLFRINQNGTLSKSKRSVGFWPIFVTVSDRFKTLEARAWNKAHAEIEIVDNVDRKYIREHFEIKTEQMKNLIDAEIWQYGRDSKVVERDRKIMAHYKNVAESIGEKSGAET